MDQWLRARQWRREGDLKFGVVGLCAHVGDFAARREENAPCTRPSVTDVGRERGARGE